MNIQGWAVGVVVPARNEEQTIDTCVDSILTALEASDQVTSSWVVIVADSCQDLTAERARARLGAHGEVVVVDAGSPGGARRLGVDRVLKHFRSWDSSRTWIANTDADSEPQADWISQQLALANQQYCGVAGVIQLNSIDGQTAEVVEQWQADYLRAANGDTAHPHVHGANLGVRADAYVHAGGWSNLALAEDHCLWDRVCASGWTVVSSIACIVNTSGRLNGRAKGGFADCLRQKVELFCA